MFSGLSTDAPPQTGKKIFGVPPHKEAPFALGWETPDNLNGYQMRKSKNREVTGKITTQSIIQPQLQHKPLQPKNSMDHYQKMFEENPDLSNEELQKMIEQYQNTRQTPSRSTHDSGNRRTPIRPRESMKQVIYGGHSPMVSIDRYKQNYGSQPDSYNYYPPPRH